jgi:DNA-binding MarR family transcriptional regulator
MAEPTNPTRPSSRPAGSPKPVLSRAERQVLAYLYMHNGPVPQERLTNSADLLMGGIVLEVLASLSKRGLVRRYADGWALLPLVLELMDLGTKADALFTLNGLEGVRDVL